LGTSYNIGSYAGIPVKLHWSLGLLFLFLIYFGHEIVQLDNTGLAWFLFLVVSLFLSVIFHEFGHALMAKKYGINTKDIILSPIGGIARLEHIPKKPMQELLVAIAGPLVNLIIALLIFLTLLAANFPLSIPLDSYPQNFQEFLRFAFWLNIILFAFNLIPAFPMDGGRILRALLSMKMDAVKATTLASNIGKCLAILMIGIALVKFHPVLFAIGIAILYMAGSESKQVILQEKLKRAPIRKILREAFTRIQETDNFSKALTFVHTTNEKNFLVFDQNESVVGSLPELFLKNYDTIQHSTKSVHTLMSTKSAFLDSSASVMEAYEMLNDQGLAIVGVKEGSVLIGVVDRNDVADYIESL